MQINRVVLQTSVLKELTAFYKTAMSLPVASKNENETTIRIGSTELVFKQVSAADPFYHVAIKIPANKIEEAKAWLSGRVELIWMDDYKSDIADFVNWHAKSVYFFDPAGNIIELIARFDLANKADGPFSSEQFLSISEMGLAVKGDEFDKSVNNLLEKYRLSYFAKQPPLPQFRAIGDDEGLFIVVPENRNWFPTDKASGIFPMEIQFENEGKEYKLKV
jgi:catechol 2,3-dioxygenase-like lactoylglutathione lyase family enzyme